MGWGGGGGRAAPTQVLGEEWGRAPTPAHGVHACICVCVCACVCVCVLGRALVGEGVVHTCMRMCV
jgi:hypothetical protein